MLSTYCQSEGRKSLSGSGVKKSGRSPAGTRSGQAQWKAPCLARLDVAFLERPQLQEPRRLSGGAESAQRAQFTRGKIAARQDKRHLAAHIFQVNAKSHFTANCYD